MEKILNHLYDIRNNIANSINNETTNRRILDNSYNISVNESNTKLNDLQEELTELDKALTKLNRG